MENLTIDLQSTDSEIVTSTAVLSNLDYPKVSEPAAAYIIIDSLVDSPSASGSFLLESLLFFFHLQIVIQIVTQVNPSIQDAPVNFVVRSFQVPVHEYMSSAVSISQRVACRNEMSAFTKVYSKKGEWLI